MAPPPTRETLSRAVDGELALLYVAPERFASARFVPRIRDARIGLFVVDEAHCVSQWGHDFRPDYFSLAAGCQALGARATVALTATATPSVARGHRPPAELDDPLVVTTGFDRPNLTFEVRPCPDPRRVEAQHRRRARRGRARYRRSCTRARARRAR